MSGTMLKQQRHHSIVSMPDAAGGPRPAALACAQCRSRYPQPTHTPLSTPKQLMELWLTILRTGISNAMAYVMDKPLRHI